MRLTLCRNSVCAFNLFSAFPAHASPPRIHTTIVAGVPDTLAAAEAELNCISESAFPFLVKIANNRFSP